MTYTVLLLSHFHRSSKLNFGVPLPKYNYLVVKITHFTTHGGTSLIISSFHSHHKVVEFLIGAEANPDQQDRVRTGRDSGVYSSLSTFDGTLWIL